MSGSSGRRGPAVAPILLAIVLGGLTGWAVGPEALFGSFRPLEVFELLGTLFLNLLKMLIVPILMASIITGAASLGAGGNFGRLFRRTAFFYVFTAVIAVLIALPIVNIVQPGIANGAPARDLLALEGDANAVTANVAQQVSSGMLSVVMQIVPDNIVAAAADNRILGLVLFCLLFGFFLARVEEPFRSAVVNFWQGTFRVVILVTDWVMWLAPVGVFALAARAVAKSGLDAVGPLLTFSACVLAGLAIYAFIAVPAIVRVAARSSPWPLFSAMSPALLTAFATASSSASLPISLECMHERARVSERITSFVLPLGTSINHAGSALYECAAVLFIAQAYGVDLPISTQLVVVGLIVVVTMGVGGVPAASLVGIAVILAAIGLPTEAIGILLVVDRFLDMCRTAVNVLANAACTVIVARREGENGVLARVPGSAPQVLRSSADAVEASASVIARKLQPPGA